MGNRHEAKVTSVFSGLDKTMGRIDRNLAMTPDADRFLTDLAHRTGQSEGDVIRLALGMLKTALDAKEQGKHVGVTGKPESLDVELVGF